MKTNLTAAHCTGKQQHTLGHAARLPSELAKLHSHRHRYGKDYQMKLHLTDW